MRLNNIAYLALLCSLFLSLYVLRPLSAEAAQQVLRSGVTLGHEYDSNIDRHSAEEQSEWTSSITPRLTYKRAELTNNFLIDYAPSVVYSYHTDNERIDQYLQARYDSSLTQKWLVYMQDTFVLDEDPYSDPVADETNSQINDKDETIQVSDRRGRNRYWTNNFSTGSRLEYARQSFAKLGYQYQVFDNKEAAFADFVRHSPSMSILHRLNHQWDSQFDYRFIKGDFDEGEDLASNTHHQSRDLKTHASDLYLYYKLKPLTTVFGRYGYSQTKYDERPNDYYYHLISAGLNHQISPTLNLGLEGGMSLLQMDNLSDHDAVQLRIALIKAWERNSWSLSADSGLDEQQFSGTDDQGLSRFWAVRTTYHHNFIKDLTGLVSLSYRDDTYLERIPESDEQRVQGDAMLTYSFAQWYQIALRYSYINQNADLEFNQYNDHRVLLEFSVIKDLLKW